MAENIRFTHFSRNPKIAEFLKAYDFVKEYGEGVDRMCKELEAAGQKNPAIQDKNPAIQDENPAIQGENPAIQDKKLDIGTIKELVAKQNYFIRTEQKLLEVYHSIDANQIFGAPEVKQILDCTSTVSKDIMKKLRDMDIVVEVKGMGKGKYRFVNKNEVKTK
ncbi:ATP-binding protein [Sporofaciens musculi]|uniref:ATP-binding protein n=1 Tax=Sporofaciens musculi TaxID=2681861 RepID=UPI0025A1BE6E|nr:ATP-binding protein [Sporofaciens musculi]